MPAPPVEESLFLAPPPEPPARPLVVVPPPPPPLDVIEAKTESFPLEPLLELVLPGPPAPTVTV